MESNITNRVTNFNKIFWQKNICDFVVGTGLPRTRQCRRRYIGKRQDHTGSSIQNFYLIILPLGGVVGVIGKLSQDLSVCPMQLTLHPAGALLCPQEHRHLCPRVYFRIHTSVNSYPVTPSQENFRAALGWDGIHFLRPISFLQYSMVPAPPSQ